MKNQTTCVREVLKEKHEEGGRMGEDKKNNKT